MPATRVFRLIRLPASLPAPLLAILALTAIVRVWPWLRPHTFTGVLEYDDGVYYAASRALLHGLVPYRDFTLVHPPLTSILLLPFAAIGAVFGDPVGMAAARLAVVLVAMGNAVLIVKLAEASCRTLTPRSETVGLAAAAIYAVCPAAVGAEHTLLLEPVVNALALLALWTLRTRPLGPGRAAAAGALAGGALTVKLFAAVYAVVLVVWLLATGERRRLLPLTVGLVSTAAAIVLPFWFLAGPAMWHDVVVTQLNRPADGNAGVLRRVQGLAGLPNLAPGLVLLVAAAVLVLVVRVLSQHPRRDGTAWLWPMATVLFAASFLLAPSYFDHYADSAAPSWAITISLLLCRRPGRPAEHRAALALAAAVCLGFVVGTTTTLHRWQGQSDLAGAGRMVPKHACVYYDAVSLALAADRFAPPSARCPAWLDGRGVAIVGTPAWRHPFGFYPEGFVTDSSWQSGVEAQVARADFLLLEHDPATAPEWCTVLRRYVLTHFVRVWESSGGRVAAQLWERRPVRRLTA